jgi:hypothetical protein
MIFFLFHPESPVTITSFGLVFKLLYPLRLNLKYLIDQFIYFFIISGALPLLAALSWTGSTLRRLACWTKEWRSTEGRTWSWESEYVPFLQFVV